MGWSCQFSDDDLAVRVGAEMDELLVEGGSLGGIARIGHHQDTDQRAQGRALSGL